MPRKPTYPKPLTRMATEHKKGRVSLMVFLDMEDALVLENLVKKERLTKSDVVRRLIRNADR
jgi:hypothetical protein